MHTLLYPKIRPFRHGFTPQWTRDRKRYWRYIRQFASGHWQVQIRLKGRKVTETFLRQDARPRMGAGRGSARSIAATRRQGVARARAKTFGALIDLHIDDMKEVGKPPGPLEEPPPWKCSSANWARVTWPSWIANG